MNKILNHIKHAPIQATLSVMGAYGGAILGVFSLGMFVPWANTIVSDLHEISTELKTEYKAWCSYL